MIYHYKDSKRSPRSPNTRPTLLQVLSSCPLCPSLHAAHGQATHSAHEPKPAQELHPTHLQKITPIKLAQSLLKHNRVLCNSSRCSGLKGFSCGLHKAIMLSSHSPSHAHALRLRFKICVNDKVSRPTLRSVRLPGAHMPTLAIKAKRPTHLQRCFASRPQRLGATSPREAFGVKVLAEKKKVTFF